MHKYPIPNHIFTTFKDSLTTHDIHILINPNYSYPNLILSYNHIPYRNIFILYIILHYVTSLYHITLHSFIVSQHIKIVNAYL